MNRRALLPLLLPLMAMIAACDPVAPPATPAAVPAPPPPAGIERVMGQDARALQILFGEPDQDQREAGARRLQYASPACVLDAYLYPPSPGREPIVTYVDARLPNGDDVDRASCIAALSRRKEAR